MVTFCDRCLAGAGGITDSGVALSGATSCTLVVSSQVDLNYADATQNVSLARGGGGHEGEAQASQRYDEVLRSDYVDRSVVEK